MNYKKIKEYANQNGYTITRSKDIINVRFKVIKKEEENILETLTRIRKKANKIGKKIEEINYEYFPHHRSHIFADYPVIIANLKWKEKEGVIMSI